MIEILLRAIRIKYFYQREEVEKSVNDIVNRKAGTVPGF